MHGSAPDIAGRGIANPVAAIRSAALLLAYLGMQAEVERIEEAVRQTMACGVVTPDLGGAASTEDVGKNIFARLDNLCRQN